MVHAVPGAKTISEPGGVTKAGHCWRQGSKGRSHGTINRAIKQGKLSGCTFAWPAEDVT